MHPSSVSMPVKHKHFPNYGTEQPHRNLPEHSRKGKTKTWLERLQHIDLGKISNIHVRALLYHHSKPLVETNVETDTAPSS